MLRRMLPTLAVLGLGLTLLLWGLGSLQRILIAERDQAHEQVWAERNALQEYARRTLEQRLESLLDDAEVEIDYARDDPLMATQNLLLVERGRHMFPRPIRYASTEGDTAQRLYQALREGTPVRTEPGTPWARRVELVQRLRNVLAEGAPQRIEEAFRELVEHRLHYRIDGRLDLPARVASLDLLVEYADPNPKLVADLLREGLYLGDTLVLEGLQPTLIRTRERFSVADFQFLCSRVLALSERSQTRADDFQARVAEPITVSPPTVPGSLQEAALVLGGTWYARPVGPDRVVGVVIGLGDLLRSVEDEMRGRALLEPTDMLVRPRVDEGIVPLASLVLEVKSPRFARAIDDGDRRFWVKSGFVGLSAGLALVIVFLALIVQGRRQRFVELKSDFVSTVSHELRTPLAAVRLMAETLERRTAGLPAARDYPTRIVHEIDDLSFLVENILSFNRLDKGGWKPRPTRVPLRDLVDEIASDLPTTAPRPVEWHCEGVGTVMLEADRELLKLLLRNLVRNACTYNERDPIVIKLYGGPSGRGWRLHVQDNGVGLAPADRRRIFVDFYRAGTIQSRGSGLGLAICRKVMHAHGGRIAVGRTGPEGTTFTLDFPATMVAAS